MRLLNVIVVAVLLLGLSVLCVDQLARAEQPKLAGVAFVLMPHLLALLTLPLVSQFAEGSFSRARRAHVHHGWMWSPA